jgi:hypothetical protein
MPLPEQRNVTVNKLYQNYFNNVIVEFNCDICNILNQNSSRTTRNVSSGKKGIKYFEVKFYILENKLVFNYKRNHCSIECFQ